MKLTYGVNEIIINETERHSIIYAALTLASSIALLVFGLATHTFALLAAGTFIGLGSILMAWTAETKTTVLQKNGSVTMVYCRYISHKKWVRSFDFSNILKLDYVKGKNFGSGWNLSTIYLDTTFNQQISVGSRLRGNLDKEVEELASFINVPINSVSLLSVADAAKNFYNPNDSMKPVLQRPTQDQLNNESLRH